MPASRRTAPSVAPAFLGVLAVVTVLLSGGCGGSAPAEGSPAGSVADASPVVLVTGSTDGLGRELALRLAAEGAHVIIHGRNVERGAEVVAAIEAEGVGSARFLAADFASLAEVRRLADAIRRDYDRLDLLVNNAGVGPGAPGHERVLTPDGHELRFQVNYLAGFLLTRELLPLLEAGAPSRIVSITSRNQQALDFDDLRMDEGYAGGVAYGKSKLAQVLMTLDLAEEMADRGVRAFAVHPAPAMETALVRETGSTPQSTVEQGVEAVLNAIRSTDHPSGTYFFELEARPAHDQAYDLEARRRLRELSEAMVTAATAGDMATPAAPPGAR
jgi:NAD(P)-dependent dehydrogenase (short-subunit alcohol dehydrogenase family)